MYFLISIQFVGIDIAVYISNGNDGISTVIQALDYSQLFYIVFFYTFEFMQSKTKHSDSFYVTNWSNEVFLHFPSIYFSDTNDQ